MLPCHQRIPALLLDVLGHGTTERIRRGARDRLIFEATDAINFGFLEPIEQIRKVGIGLAGKADDEGGAQGELRAFLTPSLDASQRLVLRRRALHCLEDFRARVLEGNIEIGQDLALGHQADDFIDMRIRVNVLQTHPGAEFAKLARQIEEFRADLAILPRTRRIFQVNPIG